MTTANETRNERLREALRRGDPAGDPAGAGNKAALSPLEEQAMRRTVLSAAPAREPRGFRLAPAFAAAAVVLLSFAVTLSLWRAHEHPPGAPLPPIPPVTEITPPPAPEAATPAPHPELPTAVAAVSPPPSRVPRREPVRTPEPQAEPLTTLVTHPSAPDRPVEETHPERETPTRQVQFSTPGGTRIIWQLPASQSQELTDRPRGG
jgi:hypothetical protein